MIPLVNIASNKVVEDQDITANFTSFGLNKYDCIKNPLFGYFNTSLEDTEF